MKEPPAARNLLLLAGMIVGYALAVAPSGRAQGLTFGQALNATNLVWTTGGDVPWFVETTNTYDGVAAAESGNIQSNQVSWLKTAVIGPATVSYWYSEVSYSFFGSSFTINGEFAGGLLFPFNVSWVNETNDLGEGTNILRWEVFNDGAGSGYNIVDDVAVTAPRALAIATQPVGETDYAGNSFALFVVAIGTPPFQYQWCKNGTNLPGATDNALFLSPTTTNESGIYSVVVTNSQGSIVSSNAAVTILPPSPPFFTSEPASLVAYVGQTVSLFGDVDGSQTFAFQWLRDGTNLPGANSQFLALTSVSLADAGDYTLYVTNLYGSVESTNAVLTVLPSSAPVITDQPRSLEVAAGVNTWLTVDATGAPSPSYTWTGPGVSSASFGPPFIIPITDATIRFYDATTNDAGVYYVTVANVAGNAVSQDVLLTVLPPITNVVTWSQDAVDVFVTNGLAFLARGTNGLAVLNVTNPASPQLLGTVPTAGDFVKVVMSGNLALVADASAGLQILSVTNPSEPMLLGSYAAPGAADVAARSNLAYVADGANGLLILDISDPALPSLVGRFVSNIFADHVGLSGNLALLGSLSAEGGGFVAIDVSEPSQPVELGGMLTGIGNFAIAGQNAYGISSPFLFDPTLEVIALTNAAQPTSIGKFGGYFVTNSSFPLMLSVSDVRVANNLAFLAGSDNGQSSLFVVDVADPTQPIPVAYYTDTTQPTALAVDNGWMYIAGSGSPLEILKAPFTTTSPPPPQLSLSANGAMGVNLHIQGLPGRHYAVEYSSQLTGSEWKPIETMLLTNDTVALPIQPASGSGSGFFRLKQLD